MKGKYRTAIVTLAVASVVATALALLPAHRAPAGVRTATAPMGAPFQQVRVYRTPGGGLLRTETVRWQGPGSMTIVTWSSNGKTGTARPPWVGVELQNMMAQQRLLQAAMVHMMRREPPLLPLAGPWGPLPPLSIRVEWPKAAPTPTPPHAPAPVVYPNSRRTVDI